MIFALRIEWGTHMHMCAYNHASMFRHSMLDLEFQ